MITHGPPDVVLPRETTGNRSNRYGLGYLFQVSATRAGILCNLRAIGPGYVDYEDGTDVFVFDSLHALHTATPTPISRNEKRLDETTGKPRVLVKFPAVCAFWPLGAKTVDGPRHPGEGAGFGFCQALSFEMDSHGAFTWTKPFVRYVETFQLRYDGKRFQVTKRELVGPAPLPPIGRGGWRLVVPGLTTAVPDGNDLLLPVLAQRGGQKRCGVCRLLWRNREWTPTSFAPVGLGSEPSLVRAADGSLVFTTRLGGKESDAVVVWRSTDAGATWQEILRQAEVRSPSPVSVNRTVSGVPFIATNPCGAKRNKLCFWTFDGAKLIGPRLIRDCNEEFGPLPRETFWAVDHPSSAIVHLNDGLWHALLAYRIKAFHLPTRGREEPDVPQTGCYVEEILSTGPAVSEWNF